MAKIAIVTRTESGQLVADALRAAGHDAIWSQSIDQASGDVVLVDAQLCKTFEPTQEITGTAEAADVAAAPTGDLQTAAASLAGKPLADIEKQVILRTLERFKGHRLRTAAALGIGVRTLGMKIKRWREEGEPIAGRQHRPPVHLEA
jgi:DNA-binding NtrC family response regulator